MESAAASIRTTKVISILKIISIFSYVIIQEFYSVASYTQVCDHLEIIFVKGIRSVCSFFFFLPFSEKTIFAPLYCFFSSVKEQLTVSVESYF